MDLTVILLVVGAWIALAIVAALIYGRVVARADHDRDMRALQQEVRIKDAAARASAASTAAPAPPSRERRTWSPGTRAREQQRASRRPRGST